VKTWRDGLQIRLADMRPDGCLREPRQAWFEMAEMNQKTNRLTKHHPSSPSGSRFREALTLYGESTMLKTSTSIRNASSTPGGQPLTEGLSLRASYTPNRRRGARETTTGNLIRCRRLAPTVVGLPGFEPGTS
jgi:hypothetical protein